MTDERARPLRFDLDSHEVPVGAVIALYRRGDLPRIVPVLSARVVLGRTPPADIVVPVVTVSRRQCTFDFSGGLCVVEDLHSTGGTYLRGAQIHGSTTLAEGDILSVGDLHIEVRRGP